MVRNVGCQDGIRKNGPSPVGQVLVTWGRDTLGTYTSPSIRESTERHSIPPRATHLTNDRIEGYVVQLKELLRLGRRCLSAHRNAISWSGGQVSYLLSRLGGS